MLCGHTHDPAKLNIDNINVYVAGAKYYNPEIAALVTIDDNGVVVTEDW
jgi:UDP-2,3-diacylglucosamine pyrophosphatase LpxH